MKKYLIFILGIGFLHRLLFLGTRQLWTDELMQARIIRFASPSEILSRLREGLDLASPLDFFMQRGLTLLLGDSPWAMRMHAVIFGTLSIWIFYRIARFLFGDRVALYSSLLFAFYPLAYHYSQEGRPYALLLFLTLLSYDLLLRQLYGRERRLRRWLTLAGVLCLLLYTSFLGGLIVVAQFAGLALLAWQRHRPREAVAGDEAENQGAEAAAVRWSQVALYSLAALAALVIFVPWVRFALERPLLAPASEILTPKLILRIIKELGDNSYPVSVLLILGAIAGIRALLRHERRNSLTWLLTWLIVPIPLLLLLEIWAGYFFAVRHLLHVTPPILLIAGYGLSYVGERLTILPHLPYQLSSPAIVYATLMILFSVWIGQVHSHAEPADWQGAAVFLRQSVREADAVTAPKVNALLEYYSPELASFQSNDLDPGPGSLASDAVQRRLVVCYDKMWPDPCGKFRAAALKDGAWRKREFKGFTIFLRTE